MCKDLVYNTDLGAYEDEVLISLRSTVGVNLRDRDVFLLRQSTYQRRHVHERNGLLDILHDIPMLKRVIISVDNLSIPHSQFIEDEDRVLHYTCIPSEVMDHSEIYVYTDIVDHQYVGDTWAPLLRVVYVPKESKVITFPNVHYLPLNRGHFGSIRVYIKDVEGRPYSFTTGTLLCKVHIRKKKTH